jgi:hypothetical protein
MKTLTILFLLNVGAVFGEGLSAPAYDIQKMDTKTALAALGSSRSQHDAIIQSLKAFLKEKDKAVRRPDVLAVALDLVGYLHAQELVGETVDLIAFRQVAVTDRLFAPADYPVVDTLIQIGMPAVQTVMERAAQDKEDRMTLTLYAAVVRGVLGPELAASFVKVHTKQDGHLEQFKNVYFMWYPEKAGN